ncbi:putative metalloreductase Ecym_2733 [Eremothecium cymbalariae DBVPG|uniref:Probable metalloreductase AIM14 n=1 Tax=Eremothecium cymbalariae (strain CBS 270.75 / DBVPG 7215 / KCTC 17166 / NRRL Y-17582) TaxID=931890 RepID=G8JPG8_ERECY|nr:Hypothetical protein Ecym_2733 [Eremothecium cymbalariae DBVPG\
MSVRLTKKHGDTHYANIPYGYYTFGVTFCFIFGLILVRKFCSVKSSKSKSRLVRSIVDASPIVYVPTLILVLGVPFVHHYSLRHDAAVYMKRLGRVSYILIFLNSFLTIRPNYVLSDYTYAQLIPLHIWLSRFIVILGLVHGACFVVKWVLDNNVSAMEKLFSNTWNFVGFVVWLFILLLLFASTGPIRRYSYNTFFVIHQLGQWAMCLLIPVHARPGVAWPYLAAIGSIYLVEFVSKVSLSHSANVISKITNYEQGTKLVRVLLPRVVMPERFAVGSHLRISSYRKLHPLYWFLPSHPFTVASLPDDGHVELIVREHNNFTFQLGSFYTVVNHYEGISSEKLAKAKRVAIVVGGAGISLGLPIFRYLKQQGDIDYIKFVWMVRNESEMHVIDDKQGIDVFVTQGAPDLDNAAVYSTSDTREDHIEHFELESLDDIDMEASNLDESGALIGNKPFSATDNAKIKYGCRINWSVELASFVNRPTYLNHLLIVCGPKGLVNDGEAYAEANAVDIYKELYVL